MHFVYLFIVALFFIAPPNAAMAVEKHLQNGYVVNLEWHHGINLENKNIMIMDGSATKGKSCKKLEIKAAFDNRHIRDYMPVATAYIENYDSAEWNSFSGEVILTTGSDSLQLWGLIDLEVNCVE